ncbi:NAD(P)/FAD-dependent oxidoreductase [Rhizobium sp. PL01]|uniref:phytoene desaturase family protein n=1 Tax=Rhizobium sp. PL01 TaxID=3085631 RepID=UPI00298195C0|nr:NAD(P)/FAD-dependent oxidoreductase [Rhizobium sp. PL01]MDW5313035.1 NAD(P)/FAD-dependent oxidoreductase [Rhizobium sp. PL01]
MTSSDLARTPSTSPATFDAIVIGGGHNGLTAATLLAQSGRKVVVLEAAESTGGTLRGFEFHPGYRSTGLAHIVNRLDPDVATLLKLETKSVEPLPTVALSADGKHAVLRGAYGETIDGASPAEAKAFAAMRKKLIFQASILKRFLKRRPPEIGKVGMRNLGSFAGAGLSLITKGREEGRDFLRMLLMNVADVADEYLSDDRLKGLVAFDATLGIHLGPRSPTSLLGLYYRLTGETGGRTGTQYIPQGGMNTLAPAFEKAAISAGVSVRTGTAVARILADRGTATGVVLDNGEQLNAPIIVSAIHPQATCLKLCDTAELGTGFARSVSNIRSRGNVAKLDLALDRLPIFTGVAADDHRGRMVIARSITHVESAFNPAKYGEFSSDPVMEITLPSLANPALAPSGSATLSALVEFAPYDLKGGWENGKPAFEKIILETLERYAPGLNKSIIAKSLMTPADMETQYNLPGGHWHHGELQADQLLVNRPVNAASGYMTPLSGLYLASAGSHPGGGISGLPGLLAARHILSGDRA